MVDQTRLRFLLERIGDELRELHRLAKLDRAELLTDPDLLPSVKYRFIVASEAAIDACRHVIASEGLRAPSNFADSFSSMGESGYLPTDLVPALRDMAGFRNLLVHGYAHVDDGRVVELLHTGLGDLEAFRRSVAERATADG